MKSRETVATIALVVLALSGCEGTDYEMASRTALQPETVPAGRAQPVAFVDITVIPMDGEHLLDGQTVIIREGRVAELGPTDDLEVPDDALVVDGSGRYLMPGLADMHVHLNGSENDLLLYLANGVTTIRDMGDGPIDYLDWRDEIEAGTRSGPNMVVLSPSIREETSRDELEFAGGGIVRVTSPEEAAELVARFAAEGYDGIKTKFNVSVEIYQALQEAARQHGLHFDGHVPADLVPRRSTRFCADNLACWDAFRQLDVEAVAHAEEIVNIVGHDQDLITAAAEDAAADGLWSSTTIAVLLAIPEQMHGLEARLDEVEELAYLNPWTYESRWSPEVNQYANRDDMDGFEDHLDAAIQMVLALDAAGAPLLVGTDAPAPFLVPGFGLHEELETLVDLGISPYDALRAATVNPAAYLGAQDDVGMVAEGMRADLVVLDDNPLEEIAATRLVRGVMVEGRWYARADLDTMLDQVAQANRAASGAQGCSAAPGAAGGSWVVMLGALLCLAATRRLGG